jgi:hypothetical protein
MSKTPSSVNDSLTQVVDRLANCKPQPETEIGESSRPWKAGSLTASTSTPRSSALEITAAMMDSFFLQMGVLYTGAWTREQAPDSEAERVNKIIWQAKFQKHGLTWLRIKDAVDSATTETLPWPNLSGFMALLASLDKTARGQNQASFRPASEVMAAQQGAKAHALLPASEEAKARRKRVGREHLAAMRASLEGL